MAAKSQDEKLIKELFDVFDKNNDGRISRKELETGMRAYCPRNMTQAELDKDITNLLKEMGIDTKKDSRGVDYKAFAQCLSTKYMNDSDKSEAIQSEKEKLMSAFHIFDKNGDGKVDKDELVKALVSLGEKMTPEEAKELIDNADTDGDKMITYTEFVHLFTDQLDRPM